MLLLLLILEYLSVFSGAIVSGVKSPSRRATSPSIEENSPSEEALNRLSRVFRIEKVPAHQLVPHRTPPQYMVDLYGSLAYQNGITKQDTPYGSDVVRGLPDRGEFTYQRQVTYCYVVENLNVVKMPLFM